MKVFMGRYPGKRSKKTGRTIRIRIDPWDTWGMDHTLSHLIVPMLLQLKETKQGRPLVENEDVPPELWRPESDGDEDFVDENFHARWDWVLDEMIWAMTQIRDESWEDQYHDKGVFDAEGYRAHAIRIQNGCRLFGVYFQSLWD